MSLKYNKSDVRHAKEIFFRLRAHEEETGVNDGPEPAMFSFGYGDVWIDGEVTASGFGVVFALDDDGDLVDDPTIDGEE
jgi:hypothetical protein